MSRSTLALTFLILLNSSCAASADKRKLSPDVTATLAKAEKLELYSLEPYPSGRKGDPAPAPSEMLHGYRILGHTTLADAKARAELLDELHKGIAANEGIAAACFNPRHALRATVGDKTIDLVICFQCLQISVFVNDKREQGVLTTADAQPLFNKILEAAKIPLAPKE